MTQLAGAHAKRWLEEKPLAFTKPKLLAVDELGQLPFEADAARLSFFQLVSRCYERGSMLVTSNRYVAEWAALCLRDQAPITPKPRANKANVSGSGIAATRTVSKFCPLPNETEARSTARPAASKP